MKLYFFPIAPNPTRVRLYVAEKRAAGATIELEEVPVNRAFHELLAVHCLVSRPESGEGGAAALRIRNARAGDGVCPQRLISVSSDS